jgi:DNA repair protein RAD16
VPSIADGDDISEGAIVSEIELEYDENASIEESDTSGSEFQASEDDEEAEDDEEEYVVKPRKFPHKRNPLVVDEDFLGSDDDEIMLDAAIHESLQTACLDNGVGSSSRPSAPSNSAAAVRAAAAERRLARANQAIDVDDAAFLIESDAENSSDEETFSKAKAKAPKNSATVHDTTSTKFMSISQRRKLNREQRRLGAAARRGNRKEELAMVKLLGRKLTYVRLKSSANGFCPKFNSSSRLKNQQSHSTNITKSSRTSGVISKIVYQSSCPGRRNNQRI